MNMPAFIDYIAALQSVFVGCLEKTLDRENAYLGRRKQTERKRTSTNSKILSKILQMQFIQR